MDDELPCLPPARDSARSYRLVQAQWTLRNSTLPPQEPSAMLGWAHLALNWSDSDFENLAYFCPICTEIWATARTSPDGLTRCIHRRCERCGSGALALCGSGETLRFELPLVLLAREARLAVRASNYFELLTTWNGKASLRPRTEHELGLITASTLDIG